MSQSPATPGHAAGIAAGKAWADGKATIAELGRVEILARGWAGWVGRMNRGTVAYTAGERLAFEILGQAGSIDRRRSDAAAFLGGLRVGGDADAHSLDFAEGFTKGALETRGKAGGYA